MAGMAANVALKALAYGAPKIPDKLFHSIPGGYFRPEDVQDSKKKHKKNGKPSRRTSRRDSYSPDEDYYTSGDEEARREARRQERRRERQRRAQSTAGDGRDHDGRDYHRKDHDGERWDPRRDSEQARRDDRKDHDGERWDPRRDSEQASRDDRQPSQDYDPYLPRPYNPAEYAVPAAAAAAAAGTAAAQERQSHQMYEPDYRQPANPYDQQRDERLQSTAESRYRPSNYSPSIPSGYAAPPPVHPGQAAAGYTPPQSAEYPPSTQYPYNAAPYAPSSYGAPSATQVGMRRPAPPLYRQPSYSQPSSPTRADSRRHRRRKSTTSGSSIPRSMSGVRERLHNMDDNERKMAASAVGALAGGLLGHEIVHSDVGTALGAALGGLALRGWEKKQEEKRSEAKEGGRDQGFKQRYDRGYRDSPDRSGYNDEARHGRRRSRRYSSDGYDSS